MSCDDNANCGRIIVNIDGDDVAIPAASTQGSANFEVLNEKLDDKISRDHVKLGSKVRKLYYFSPFEQYIEDESMRVDSSLPFGDEENDHDALHDKTIKAKESKNSDGFKKRRRDLEDAGLTSFIRKSSLGFFPTRAAANTIPDTFVPGASTSMCGSRIPCYKYDATYSYSTGTCKFGCVPTSIAMIYGYHDRQGTYPNLVTGTAKDYIDSATTDSNITTMINSIRTSVGTFCSN